MNTNPKRVAMREENRRKRYPEATTWDLKARFIHRRELERDQECRALVKFRRDIQAHRLKARAQAQVREMGSRRQGGEGSIHKGLGKKWPVACEYSFIRAFGARR